MKPGDVVQIRKFFFGNSPDLPEKTWAVFHHILREERGNCYLVESTISSMKGQQHLVPKEDVRPFPMEKLRNRNGL